MASSSRNNDRQQDQETEAQKANDASKMIDVLSNMFSDVKQWMAGYEGKLALNEQQKKKHQEQLFEKREEESRAIYQEQMGFDENEAFREKITEMTIKLTKAAGIAEQIECLGIRSDEANAFVFSLNKEEERYEESSPAKFEEGCEKGRLIYIYTGLVKILKDRLEKKGKILTEGHVAAVIAHEMRHLIQQKTEPAKRPPTRKQSEYDADIGGVEIMGKAGYNPRDFLDVMEIFSDLSGEIGYSRTHPATTSRIAEISARVSSTDIPLFGLSAEKKPMKDLPVSPSRASEMIRDFSSLLRESGDPKILAEKIGNSNGQYFKCLMQKELLCDAMKYSIYQEVASDSRLTVVLIKYLYIKGVEIANEIVRMKGILEKYKKERDELNHKKQSGPLTYDETQTLEFLEKQIDNQQNESPISTVLPFRIKITRPEDNSWLQEWRKMNPALTTDVAKAPEAQQQIEHLCDENIRLDIAYSSDSVDMSAIPAVDWGKMAEEWIEKGTISGDIGEKIQHTLDLWPKWRGSHADIPYEFAEEEARRKFKSDFFVNILYARPMKSGFAKEMKKQIEEQTRVTHEPLKKYATSLLSDHLNMEDKETICRFLDPKNGKISLNADQIKETLRILPDLMVSPSIFFSENLGHLCSQRMFTEHYLYLIIGRLSDEQYQSTQDSEAVETTIQKLAVRFGRELHQLRSLSKNSIPGRMREKITWYEDRRKTGAEKEVLYSLRQRIILENDVGGYTNFHFLTKAYQISYDHGRNPIHEEDANAFLKALIEDGFSKEFTLEMLQYLYSSISESEYMMRLKIEAVMIRLGSHITIKSETSPLRDLKETSAIRNIQEISQKTGKPIQEILKLSGENGLYFTSEDLLHLVDSDQISIPDLIAHYEAYQIHDRYSSISIYHVKILNLICILNALELNPGLAEERMQDYRRIGIITINSVENSLLTLFTEQRWPLATILNRFPACHVRDSLLYDHWKRNNFSVEVFKKILPSFDRENPYGDIGVEFSGRNGITLKNLKWISLKDQESENEGERLHDQLSSDGSLSADEHVYGFYDQIGYLKLLEKKYEQDPRYFVNPERSFMENRATIIEMCPSCEFRDYLLLRALKIEVHKMNGRTEFMDPEPFTPMIPNETLREKLVSRLDIISFYDDLEMPDLKNLNKDQEFQLVSLLRIVSKDIQSPQSKIAIGRMAIDHSHELLVEKTLLTILEFLPDPSPTRDDYLKNLMLKNRFSVEKIKEMEALLSHNIIQTGKVSDGGLVGIEVIRNEIKRLEGKDRMTFLLWLLRIENHPPHFLRVQGGLFGMHFESLRDNFSVATDTEKKEFLRETLLFKNGLLQPTNADEEKLMVEFLEKVYESKFSVGSGDSPLFKDIFMTVFKKFLPERRVALFTSLFLALEESRKRGEDNLSFDEISCLFLEQSGGVAIKLGQILSESNEIPFSDSHEPMPPAFRKRLSKLKDGVEPFSTVGAVRRLEENHADGLVKYIDGLLSTASIKQAHKIETEHGKAVLKVRRPALENVQHDFEVLESVFETLERHGKTIPQYLIEELKAIIADEADFNHEANNQQKIAKNLSPKRSGWTLKIPAITFSSQDVMIEDFAEGIPLNEIKTTNPNLYEEISRLIGMELLSGICETGICHADLHDGNVFVSPEQRTVTFIDAGAVADTREFKKPVLQLIKGIIFKRPGLLANAIIALSQDGEGNASEIKARLKKKLQTILQEPITLEQKISKISFEILHVVNPKPALRYLLKALATGAHHFEHLGKNWDLSRMKDTGEMGKYLLKIWMS